MHALPCGRRAAITTVIMVATSAATAPRPAAGHGLDAGRAEAQLRDRTLFVVVAPSTSWFAALDRDGDGELAVAEVQARRADLQAGFLTDFVVVDQDGRAPALTFFDVSVPVGLASGAAPYLRFTAQLAWPEVPASIAFATTWAGAEPLWLEAVRVTARGPGRWVAVGPTASVRLRDGALSAPLLAATTAASPPSPRPAATAAARAGTSSTIPLALTLGVALGAGLLAWLARRERRVSPAPGAPR